MINSYLPVSARYLGNNSDLKRYSLYKLLFYSNSGGITVFFEDASKVMVYRSLGEFLDDWTPQ